MIKYFILFILYSLSMTTYAVSTVSDIESTINSGDYTKAKEQLKEVLDLYPDSVVANKYMLEIIKIEYAGSLKPSVEFKVYENKLKQIETDKQLKLQTEREALAEKKRAESYAKFKTFIFNLILVLIFSSICVGLYLLITNKIKEEREKEEHIKWLEKIKGSTNKLNEILSKHISDKENFKSTYNPSLFTPLNFLYLDNLDVIKAINAEDYSVEKIEHHLKNSWSFLDKYGIE